MRSIETFTNQIIFIAARLSMVAATDSATRDNGGSRRWRALWAGFSLAWGNYAPDSKQPLAYR